jgi:hypothetical protein
MLLGVIDEAKKGIELEGRLEDATKKERELRQEQKQDLKPDDPSPSALNPQ